MGTFSIWYWIVVLIIVVLVFGTKKLRNLGGDLGGAIKNFKEGMKDADTDNTAAHTSNPSNLTFDQQTNNRDAEFKEASQSENSAKTTEPAAAATEQTDGGKSQSNGDSGNAQSKT